MLKLNILLKVKWKRDSKWYGENMGVPKLYFILKYKKLKSKSYLEYLIALYFYICFTK